jgi:arabinose-5-phosphate isomerase
MTPISAAKSLLAAESSALSDLSSKLGDSFEKAVGILSTPGRKVLVTGVGKSALIGQKIAATLCSTGTPSVFIHATDAVHGDLGIHQPGDSVLMLSRSGTTAELLALAPHFRSLGSPLICVVANPSSPLAAASDVVLDIGAHPEADPLGLVPTTSAILTLAMGDALAAALMVKRGFRKEDFAKFHPAGQLGRNLLLTVADVLKPLDTCAVVAPETSLRDTVIAMTKFPLGAALLSNPDGSLAGIITDGDLRRALSRDADLLNRKASDIATAKPVRGHPGLTLGDAARLMENRPSQISVLPITDPSTDKILGVLRIHDIYQAGMV